MSKAPDTTDDFVIPPEVRAARWTAAAAARVDVAGLSDPGLVRSNNEDHFLICRFGRWLEVVETNVAAGRAPGRSEEAGYGLVVADDLGGGAAGEVASERAIVSVVAKPARPGSRRTSWPRAAWTSS